MSDRPESDSRPRSPRPKRGRRSASRQRGGGAKEERSIAGSRFTAQQLAARAAALPVVSYPDLPVSAHRAEIAHAIREHQVVIVAGETGSGKTTQLPKICLELGRGIAGLIGHTQPRRIAARAVAERVAAELGSEVGRQGGDIIGYQVRFTDEVGPTTLVKLMTDGILLAEIGSDPSLEQYDTIIVDEAHERSLNIDFILGYLATLLPRRPDLKVIITSATIDSGRFAAHFSKAIGADVPVIEVSGRAYPVEVRYRPLTPDLSPVQEQPLADPGAGSSARAGTQLQPEEGASDLSELGYGLGDDFDLESALCEAVGELLHEPEGDILVFLPGERDIREAERTLADYLGNRYVKDPKGPHRPDGVEIVPLYARLSAAEQHRIYAPHSLRRIVLSTNIAETSLTVPQIRFVIDSGLARISRFSNKTKVQRLPIERISQASASQRSGRAGRTAPGVAIRLFSLRDHLGQTEFTEPEILRTSLASVILQMSALGLGEVAKFPFLDPPNSRAVRDGMQLLAEIGALDPEGNITSLGRRLARLPIDPRLGRMLIEADRLGCASEVLVVVAALSIQDVRERPVEYQAQSDQAHARFADRSSDFLTYLNMWRYLGVMSRDLSGSAFRRLCKSEFFHYLRYREWRDIVAQIRRMCGQMGIEVDRIGLPSPRMIATLQNEEQPAVAAVLEFGSGPGAAQGDEVHRAILSGLLSNVGNWDEVKRNYQGARNTRFTIWPGSALRRRTPAWVMAAELVETSRLYARTVASIKPEWIEHYAGSLLKRSYAEPTWSRGAGAAMIKERVTLYGLTLAADRQVPLSRLGNQTIGRTYLGTEVQLDAATLAREMFISNALVDGEWRENHHAFVRRNKDVMQQAEDLADRLRDPSMVPDQAVRYRFFDARLPADICSAAAFNRWWKKTRTVDPALLDYSLRELLPEAGVLDSDQFPDSWAQGELRLPVSYSFNPGGNEDGVTVTIPLHVLAQVRDEGFDWLVPGLLQELCIAMIRGLPKAKRRLLAPSTQTGQLIHSRLTSIEDKDKLDILQQDDDDSEEEDPYSLSASLDRLKAWGAQAGSVRGTDRFVSSVQPAPDHERGGENGRKAGEGVPFGQAFRSAVRDAKGVELSDADIKDSARALPGHLRVGFRVIDQRGAVVAVSDSLMELRRQLRDRADRATSSVVRSAVAEAAALQGQRRGPTRQKSAPPQDPERAVVLQQVGELPVEPIPHKLEQSAEDGLLVRGYPALSVRGDSPGQTEGQFEIRVFANLDDAHREHRRAMVRLLLQDLRLEQGRVTSRWTGREALLLAASPYPDTGALVADAQHAAMCDLLDQHCVAEGAFRVRSREQYERLRGEIRDLFEDKVHEILSGVIRAVEAYSEVEQALSQHRQSSLQELRRQVKDHADGLFTAGYLTRIAPGIRAHIARYLRADAVRLNSAARSPRALVLDQERDDELSQVVEAFREAQERASRRPFSLADQQSLAEVEMLLQELRVSFFAQSLGTAHRVSAARLLRRIDGIEQQ